ncbi:MAG: nucleotidyltransferase domain-containing protein [Candidatus Cloacimonetes bacterium]|nr:nucleotidyltransferase domain-containing protein [Candidatus Cloacimonadota bacterium]
MNKVQRLIQKTIFYTNPYFPFKYLNRLAYIVVLKLAIIYLKKIPQIQSILLRGSMASGNYTPGLSDIDLMFIIRPLSVKDEINFLKLFWKRFKLLHAIFPLFAEIRVMNEEEWKCICKWGSIIKIAGSKVVWGKKIKCDLNIDKRKIKLDFLMTAYYWYPHIHYIILLHPNWWPLSVIKKRMFEKFVLMSQSKLHFPQPDIKKDANKLFPELLKDKNSDKVKKMIECVNLKENFDADILSFSIKYLSKLSRNFKNETHDNTSSSPWKLTKHKFEQETKEKVLQHVNSFVGVLSKQASTVIDSIILSSSGCKNYDYKLYILMSEKIKTKNLKKLLEEFIEKINSKDNGLPSEFFVNFNFPLFVTKDMFSTLYAFHKSPLEYFYFQKHMTVIQGSDNIKIESAPADLLKYSLLSYISRILVDIRRKFKSFRSKTPKINFITNMIDYVTGIFPAAKLILDKGIITTTPKETLHEYCAHYDDEYKKFLVSFYEQYVKKDIDDLMKVDADKLYFSVYPYLKKEMIKLQKLME